MNQLRRESSVAHLNPDTEEASVQDAVGASTLEKYEGEMWMDESSALSVQASRIRRDVANDIKALLSRTKAYVQHSTTRPTSNPEHTKRPLRVASYHFVRVIIGDSYARAGQQTNKSLRTFDGMANAAWIRVGYLADNQMTSLQPSAPFRWPLLFPKGIAGPMMILDIP
eukprot:1161124-Pelagomonas_calceolata.AAC.1